MYRKRGARSDTHLYVHKEQWWRVATLSLKLFELELNVNRLAKTFAIKTKSRPFLFSKKLQGGDDDVASASQIHT
jgi:hypothetical protein